MNVYRVAGGLWCRGSTATMATRFEGPLRQAKRLVPPTLCASCISVQAPGQAA